MLDSELVLIINDQVNRLGGLIALAEIDDQENEIAAAFEKLQGVALVSIAEQEAYTAALNEFISLMVLGNAQVILPVFRSEIERTELNSDVEIITVTILIGGYAVLLLDNPYPSREDAVKARSVLSALVDVHAEIIGDRLGFEVWEDFLGLTGNASEELSRIAASQIPLVRVEMGIELPSTLLAYRLYQDPERSQELIARNKIATPAYMPLKFEALSA